ncbi:MAG: SGNH/GDSL hydrolase family protein [Gammaproteobacteria bacterium]|nr:SGNH/GDSL hydrolase family protein [Gammaproteobacteria bacterium]
MKVIVCYGDSNTWGADPGSDGDRFAHDERWTGVLRSGLGEGYWIIEEGLNGRTTVWDDPIEGDKSGKAYLAPCLETHRPFDLITLMLGTNDTKQRFSLSAADIAAGMETLVKLVKRSEAGRDGAAPGILVMAPPPIATLSDYRDMFSGATEKSRQLGRLYAKVAADHGCHFFDTGAIIVSSDLDGIHFEKSQHQRLGEALVPRIRELLGH